MNGRCWCGRPATVKREPAQATCGYHDAFGKEIANSKKRKSRAKAGEMGIELAKWIHEHKNERINQIQVVDKAQAIFDKLAEK